MSIYSKRHEKETMMFLKIITVLFIVILATNIALSVYADKIFNLNIFTLIISIVWVYGYLCSRGFFKKIVSKSSNGRIQYTTRTPIAQIGIIRIIEFIWLLLQKKHEVHFGIFAFQVVLDVIMIAVMLMDKSAYYYESRVEDEEE